MAIDGRDWAQPGDGRRRDDTPWTIKMLAKAAFFVPLALLVWLTYWSGTFFGGVTGGVLSVVSTAATVAFVWFIRRNRRH
jgi:hypothetical protein